MSGRAGGDEALVVRDVAFRFPDGTEALSGVDLVVEEGERVAVLGPNGAGKTTFVLHLNGIHMPTRGSVTVTGLPVEKENLREIRRRVGVVFQDPDDQLFMPTVREDVGFGPANLGLDRHEIDERVAEALASVGMSHAADRVPHHLSFGERRRIAVATVLSMRPRVLVLDEPSSNLDPAARRELAEIVLALPITIILVTHDLPYALQLCERSVVLNGGRVVADGPTRDLLVDRDAMAANRLELPFGFDPLATRSTPAIRFGHRKSRIQLVSLTEVMTGGDHSVNASLARCQVSSEASPRTIHEWPSSRTGLPPWIIIRTWGAQ